MLIHVTGARGFLGCCVVQTLAEIGHIQASDIDSMDVTESSSVMDRFRECPPDVVVHLAALKGNIPSRERPIDFFKVNTLGTLNLLEACRHLGTRRFVFMSSLTVHGETDSPLDESSLIRPLHPYGASKAAGEALVHAYTNSYGIQSVIFRPNFIVGSIPLPHPYQDNLIYDFMQELDRKGAIELAGNGMFKREWLHPQDVADAIKLAILEDIPGCETFVLAANRLAMIDLANGIVSKVGRGCVRTNPARSGFTLISSSKKARGMLNWRPRKDIDNIISEIWDEYRTRKNHSHHRLKPRDWVSPD